MSASASKIKPKSGGPISRTFAHSVAPESQADFRAQPLEAGSTGTTYKSQYDGLRKERAKLFALNETEWGKDKDNSALIEGIVAAITALPSPPRSAMDAPLGPETIEALNRVVQDITQLYARHDAEAPPKEQAVPWARLRRGEVSAWIDRQNLRADKLVQEKLAAHSGKFGWTNVKGAVAEFFAGGSMRAVAEGLTIPAGGEARVCTLEVIARKSPGAADEAPEDYISIAEIDHAILVKDGATWNVALLGEAKSNAKSDARSAQRQLQEKLKALQKITDEQEIWCKIGSTLVENVTDNLTCTATKSMSVGPVDSDGAAQFDSSYTIDYALDEITDQLAIEWLDANAGKTLAEVSFGTGAAASSLSKL